MPLVERPMAHGPSRPCLGLARNSTDTGFAMTACVAEGDGNE